ncbi:hypothetical protein [Sanguibacter sp. 25GB23B1]|uniref:hypothetical protein n=1 Tax=unclassified Sanguibacter TaxID=2645534 RepID=UPI0032AFB093
MPTPGRSHRRTTRDAVVLWTTIAAVVLGLAGLARLVAWGNRWYVAEMFAGSASDSESWAFAYEKLLGAHAALLSGVLLLQVAVLLAICAIRVRRASRR